MWDGPTFQSYYQQIGRIIRKQLDAEDPDYLLRVDFEEYLDFLVGESEWEPLTWDESQMTIEPFSVKHQRTGVRGQTYFVEDPQMRIRIPVTHHPQRSDYFKFGPTTTWSFQREPAGTFEGDVLIHEVDASEESVQKGLDAIRFWLGNRNKDIEAGNKQLKERIRSLGGKAQAA